MSWSRWYPAVRRQWNNVQQLESSWFLGGRQAGLTWSPVLQVVFSIRIQENLLLFFSYLNSLLFSHVKQDVALLLDGTAAGRGWDLACVPWILQIALETHFERNQASDIHRQGRTKCLWESEYVWNMKYNDKCDRGESIAKYGCYWINHLTNGTEPTRKQKFICSCGR